MSSPLDSNKSDNLKKLFMLFADRVRQAAYFVVRDDDVADDVMQETFLTAIENLSQLSDVTKVEAWLTRIAINKARNTFRYRARVVSLAKPLTSDDNVEDLVLKKEEIENLRAAITRLPEDLQLVIFLRYNSQMPIKDIALALDIAEGTVKSRLYRAREILREIYLEKKEAQDD